MSRSQNHVPAYKEHKPSGRGRVIINRRQIYLPGPYKSRESKAAYDRIIAEYLAGGRTSTNENGISIAELCMAFWNHAKKYYRKADGSPTSEQATFRGLLKMLRETYGVIPAKDFGPLQLQAIRQKMVGRNWCRKYVNAQADRIKQIFKWATAQAMLPAGVYEALRCVSGLRIGRTDVRESSPVRPVSQIDLEATIKHLNPTIKAIVELQSDVPA